MSIWQHILKFCEDNRRQKKKKNLAPVHLLSAQQAAYEDWKEVAQRQIDWTEPLYVCFLFPSIYAFQLFSVQAGDPDRMHED